MSSDAAATPAAAPAAAAAPVNPEDPKTLFELNALDAKKKPVDFSQYAGKVVLVVNVASKCGQKKKKKDSRAPPARSRCRGQPVCPEQTPQFVHSLQRNESCNALFLIVALLSIARHCSTLRLRFHFRSLFLRSGFTPQYAGLEKLYKDNKDAGLVILGFPCNGFGSQVCV